MARFIVSLLLVVSSLLASAGVVFARPAFADAEWGVVRHASGVAVGDQLAGWRALGVRVAAARSPYGGGLLVLDIDECVLDNTPAEAGLCLRYSVPSWNAWCVRASASAVPGAVSVVRSAVAAGWRVAFVSARGDAVLMATIANLALAGLPVDLGTVGVFCVGSSRRKPAVFGRLLDAAAFARVPVVFGGDQVGDAPRGSYAGFGWSAFVSLPNWMY